MLKYLLFLNIIYVVNQIHFPWETGIPGLAPINIIVLVILALLHGKPDPLERRERPILQTALFGFYAVLILSFLWAQVRAPNQFIDDATYLKNALFGPFFYWLYLRCKQDEKVTRQLIIMVLIVAAVAGLEATREGFDYGFGKYNPFRRASGPFGADWHNANRAGVFYAMFMPMFVALALFLKQRKLWRLAALGSCGLLAAGALFTYSRQAYFLIILGVALLILRKSIVLAAVITVVLVSVAGYLPDSVFQRVDETKQESKTGNEEVDASTSSRWEIWAGGMDMLKQNPIGVGLHRFPKEIGNYSNHKGMDAHNFYVLTLAECGPQGLLALLYLMFVLNFRLAPYLRKHTPPEDPELRALTLGFTVCTICMGLGGIYGSPTLELSVMCPYWALCGLLERYVQLKMQRSGSIIETRPMAPSLADRFPLAAYILPGRRP